MAPEDRMLFGVWSFCGWTTVLTANAISGLCFGVAMELSGSHEKLTGGVELPFVSKLVLSGSSLFYSSSIILLIWLVVVQLRAKSVHHLRILTAVSFAFSLLFLTIWICGIVLPFSHMLKG